MKKIDIYIGNLGPNYFASLDRKSINDWNKNIVNSQTKTSERIAFLFIYRIMWKYLSITVCA